MSVTLPKLDNTCKELFQYFVAKYMSGDKPIRFNELLRNLNEIDLSISRPTLSLHLSHLVDLDMLKRTEHGKQHVTYRFYHEKLEGLTETLEKSAKITIAFEEEKKNFLSDPLSEQILYMAGVLMLRILFQLKAELLSYSDPENKFKYQLQIFSYNNLWNRFVEWTVRSYQTSNENRQKEFIKELDSLIEKYQNIMFDSSLLDEI